MAITDDTQIRGWCIDYALRTPRAEPVSAEQIIKDAKVFERYIAGSTSAKVLKIARDNSKK